jgi:hypothetical protein
LSHAVGLQYHKNTTNSLYSLFKKQQKLLVFCAQKTIQSLTQKSSFFKKAPFFTAIFHCLTLPAPPCGRAPRCFQSRFIYPITMHYTQRKTVAADAVKGSWARASQRIAEKAHRTHAWYAHYRELHAEQRDRT